MDISSLVGIILAFVSLIVGMAMKGVGVGDLMNPAAILIIIFGTISAVVIAFPMAELKRVPKLLYKSVKFTRCSRKFIHPNFALFYSMITCWRN